MSASIGDAVWLPCSPVSSTTSWSRGWWFVLVGRRFTRRRFRCAFTLSLRRSRPVVEPGILVCLGTPILVFDFGLGVYRHGLLALLGWPASSGWLRWVIVVPRGARLCAGTFNIVPATTFLRSSAFFGVRVGIVIRRLMARRVRFRLRRARRPAAFPLLIRCFWRLCC